MNHVPQNILAALVGLVLAACSSSPAPVEDRSARPSGSYRLTEQGLYRVQGGDTLYSIAFHYGLDWRNVAAWNDIGRPYTIFPGQELRLTAPPRRPARETVITTRPAGRPPAATTRPADTAAAASGTSTSTAPPVPSPPESVGSGKTTTSSGTAPAAAPLPALGTPERWLWPTEGRLLSRFSAGDPSRKGIDIGGKEGQDIVASAPGDVVYSGSGLIGFGELIIIKHSDSMLTAYAHNRRRLVHEGERVAAGSRIAEMGKNDQERTMLHFELRIDGKPVDPLRYLPPR